MLDITKLLQDTIDFDNQVIEKRDLLLGPASHLQEILVQCDQALARFYQPDINYTLRPQQRKSDADVLLEYYVETLHWFLLYSARKQWTHLVVISQDGFKKIMSAKPSTKLVDLDKEYLAIKYLLFTSYYTHRQEDFRHAWHMLLKMGLVDFKLEPARIEEVHEQLIK